MEVSGSKLLVLRDLDTVKEFLDEVKSSLAVNVELADDNLARNLPPCCRARSPAAKRRVLQACYQRFYMEESCMFAFNRAKQDRILD